MHLHTVAAGPRRSRRESSAKHLLIVSLLTCLTASTGCEGSANTTDPHATVWYVQSIPVGTATNSATGNPANPFPSLAEAQAASAPGDEIRILPPRSGATSLDGGISLQKGQVLRGTESANGPPPITNTDPNRQGGDAVRLSDDVTVTGIKITGAAGHAVVGYNVQGATVTGNQIHSGNLAELTSVATGVTAGLGIVEFPKAIVAFIHDTDSIAARPNTVSENDIVGLQNADQTLTRLGGAGIALHARGSSHASLTVSKNHISDLGAGFQRSGLLIDAQDSSQLTLTVEDTRVANAYNSSDGFIVIAQHHSAISASIRGYKYVGGTPDLGVGNNGLEVVTYFGGDWLQGTVAGTHQAQTKLVIEESDIEGAGGFGVVVFNIFGKPGPQTVLDFGGGELGGHGANRIYNNGIELPTPMDLYVVHDALNVANNWWGPSQDDSTKVEQLAGSWQLKSSYAFVCAEDPNQLQALIDGTGTDAWSMFCQTQRADICPTSANAADPAKKSTTAESAVCCDPNKDASRCMTSIADSSLTSAPALVQDPRP